MCLQKKRLPAKKAFAWNKKRLSAKKSVCLEFFSPWQFFCSNFEAIHRQALCYTKQNKSTMVVFM
jgi:hypothetical protein